MLMILKDRTLQMAASPSPAISLKQKGNFLAVGVGGCRSRSHERHPMVSGSGGCEALEGDLAIKQGLSVAVAFFNEVAAGIAKDPGVVVGGR